MGGLELIWERDLHVGVNARSVIAPSLIVVPERFSKLCRVSPVDGSPVWVADVQNQWGWLAVSGSTCAYLNKHSRLQCFDLEDGVERWAVDLHGRHGSVFGHLRVVGDRVMVGGWRGYSDTLALSADDGALVWTRSTRGRAMMAPASGSGDKLLLPFPQERRCVLVAASTGEELAEWSCPQNELLPDASDFVVTDSGRFWCLDRNGRVLALDPTSDADWVELARHRHPFFSFAPTITESLLLFEDTPRRLCAYSLTSMSQLWEAPILHRRADLLPAAELPSGSLAFAAASGLLTVFDRDGQPVARRGFRKRFLAGLTRTAAGALVGANGGRLIALDASSL